MKLQHKAALITASIIFAIVSFTTLMLFFPMLFSALILGVITSVMTYHIYNDVLRDLKRRKEKDTELR